MSQIELVKVTPTESKDEQDDDSLSSLSQDLESLESNDNEDCSEDISQIIALRQTMIEHLKEILEKGDNVSDEEKKEISEKMKALEIQIALLEYQTNMKVFKKPSK